VVVSLFLGVLVAGVTSEVSYQVLKRENREPQRIELVIPAGTAEKVAAGEAPPSIPVNMSFVVGDRLVVVNQDNVDHQLGALWIPPGTSASMDLQTEENFSFACSFQPSKYLGIEVHPSVTLSTRIAGIFFAGVPMGMLLALYSVVLPSKKKKENET
jgi:hypothetical protein